MLSPEWTSLRTCKGGNFLNFHFSLFNAYLCSPELVNEFEASQGENHKLDSEALAGEEKGNCISTYLCWF